MASKSGMVLISSPILPRLLRGGIECVLACMKPNDLISTILLLWCAVQFCKLWEEIGDMLGMQDDLYVTS